MTTIQEIQEFWRREPALTPDKARYGCANKHYFAVLRAEVEVKETIKQE